MDSGGPRGIERHVNKNRKVLVRERLKMILDPGSAFIEIGKLAGFDMPYGDLPAAGVLAGGGGDVQCFFHELGHKLQKFLSRRHWKSSGHLLYDFWERRYC